jgi:hypothetical protein
MSETPGLERGGVKSRLTLFGGNTLSFVDDEQRRWLSMYNRKLDTDETSGQISIEPISESKRSHPLELLRLVTYRHAGVHRLHTQHLIVALFIIEH